MYVQSVTCFTLSDKQQRCVCGQGEFREQNFNTAMGVLKDVGDAGKGDQKGRKGGMKGQTLDSLVESQKKSILRLHLMFVNKAFDQD